MVIDFQNFTPYASLIGGVMIGLAASGMLLPVAGFIVGIGTAVGSGCTSGHGICGVARLSPRSMVAVATFMATVYLVLHVL